MHIFIFNDWGQDWAVKHRVAVDMLNMTLKFMEKWNFCFKSESFVMVGDHFQLVNTPTITSDYGLNDCANL